MTAPRDDSAVERAVAPFFRDGGLLPVTLVVVAHAVLAIALLLLDALRSPGAFSLAALAAVAAGSLAIVGRGLRRRRLGPLGATILASWVLGALAAWAVGRSGLY